MSSPSRRATAVTLAWALPLVLALATGLGGCEDPAPEYAGVPGTVVRFTLDDWVPAVQATRGGEPQVLLVDTGSPLTFVTPPPAGREAAPLEVLGLTFPAAAVVALELFRPTETCQALPANGLLGGNLLGLFRLGLDYRAREAVVSEAAGAEPPVSSETADPVTLAVEIEGGGTVPTVVGPVTAGPTRVLLPVTVEGVPATAVLDTGASLTVLGRDLLGQLPPARPRLCCDLVATAYGREKTELTRLRELRLGAAVLQNVPAMITSESTFLRPLSEEVGSKVGLLIGGSALRHFAVTVDYPRRRVVLRRFLRQDHLPADEYVAPGLSLCPARSGGGFSVLAPYEGTDAAQKVKSGERLIAVEGKSVVGLDLEALRALWRQAGEGAYVTLRFAGPPETEQSVRVERLLADLL